MNYAREGALDRACGVTAAPKTHRATLNEMTPMSRLAEAVGRLRGSTAKSVDVAMALAGSWPEQSVDGVESPYSGVFGQIDMLASEINSLCDRLDSASEAVSRRL